MILDVLLSCVNLYSKRLPIEELLASGAVAKFLHPCERETLEQIIEIINLMRKVAQFAKSYGSNRNSVLTSFITESDEPLQDGLYLKAFANSLEDVMQEYIEEVVELEQNYMQQPSMSLLFIYQKLVPYKPLGVQLNKLIRGIRMHSLHGCTIFQHIYKNSHHGDLRVDRAMKTIQKCLKVVFLKQLSHWMLYAQIIDPHSEFFIHYVEPSNTTVDSDRAPSTSSSKCSLAAEAESTYAEIWHYEINFDMLPNFLSATWAEKVLFVGQTVMMFQVDANASLKSWQAWQKLEKKAQDGKNTLWNGKDKVFFIKIQSLLVNEEVYVSPYERIVEDIKCYVTTRLSEIAINQADLVQQLRLIKDYYLMGRGELYLEFIRQTFDIKQTDDNESKLRCYVKAFEHAAYGERVGEDEERFSLNVSKSFLYAENVNAFTFLQYVQLQYKINWPLHLLFSPKVMERYNAVFCFLLLIKRMQFELHMMWCKNTHEAQLDRRPHNAVLSLRNQLMFFVDNLQYYIQVDVLESQYSILLNTVLNMANFDQIQKAHSVFQANILSLCFLLTEEDANATSMHQSVLNSNNPVHIIFNNIFHICEDFCVILGNMDNAPNIEETIGNLDKSFMDQIVKLMKLSASMEKQSKSTSLAQLILRLDFNRWFSDRAAEGASHAPIANEH